jgi:acyl-CoA reductase-like NAD-dependent aldehyde dehydrogenase
VATLTVRNPATGETIAEVPAASAKDVEAAVARARAAQPDWERRGVDERARVLRAFQAEILRERHGFAQTVTQETGKPLTEAFAVDVLGCLDAFAWATTKGVRLLRGERIPLTNPLLRGRTSRIEYEALGVVGIVSPWNYPLAIPGGQLAYALLAGNTVVLKPASYTPLVALKLREAATRAAVPQDAFIVVPGTGAEAGDALVSSDIDHLIFTGSVPVGKAVERRLRERSVISCMELGGSDPALVLHDAPFDKAVRGVAWTRFTNAGQTCAAIKRAYVHRSLYDRFVEAVATQANALRLGDPLSDETDMGPLIDANGVADMEAFVADALSRGARVVAGGKARPDLGPAYFEPTVLVDVPPDARVVTEETFGPILPIAPFDTEDEAVALANATTFGLSASVWTKDTHRGLEVARRVKAGTVVVNDAAYTFAANETPWGGDRDSGHGRTHGRWGLLDLVRMRHLNVVPANHPLGSPWWYPYGAGLREALDRGSAFLYGGASQKARHGLGVAWRLLRRRRG